MLGETTALVTGASQGIGREIAIALADTGAEVVLAARNDGIYETEDRIGDEQRTLPIETDVTDETSVAETVEAAVARFGEVDCLVNNAGIAGPTAPIEESPARTGSGRWRPTFRHVPDDQARSPLYVKATVPAS